MLKWDAINVLSTLWTDPLNITTVHSYVVFTPINFGFFFFSDRTRKHLDVLIIIFGRKLPFDPSFHPCWTSLCSCSMSYTPRNEDYLSKSCLKQNPLPLKVGCYVPTCAVNLVSNSLDIFSELIIVWLSQSDTKTWIQLKFCHRNLNEILRWETPFFFFFFFSIFKSRSKSGAPKGSVIILSEILLFCHSNHIFSYRTTTVLPSWCNLLFYYFCIDQSIIFNSLWFYYS